jgi:hypothetical protein
MEGSVSIESLIEQHKDSTDGRLEQFLVGYITAVVKQKSPTGNQKLKDIRRALIAYYRNEVQQAQARGLQIANSISIEALRQLEGRCSFCGIAEGRHANGCELSRRKNYTSPVEEKAQRHCAEVSNSNGGNNGRSDSNG